MSKEDYRERIEEHRQSINIEKPNSRQSRSRVAKNKKPRRRDPLMTILTVIFIFIPLVILVYVWGFYTPTTPSQAQTNEQESLEYEKNDKIEDEEIIIDEPVLIDDTVDENKEEDDQSEAIDKDKETQDDQNSEEEPNTGQVQGKDSEDKQHEVKSGDTLYSIADENNTTVDAIMEANGLQTPDIQVGQVLIIP